MHVSTEGSPAASADPAAPVPTAATHPTAAPAPGEIVDAVLSASRVLVAVAARSLAAVAEEVTLTQYRSLVILASRGPQSVATLAEAVGVTAPTASRLSDRLVQKGLIDRRAAPHDRRAVRLGLTPAGRDLVDAVTERRRGEIAALLEAVPPQGREPLVHALRQLTEAAGEVPEQEWSSGWDL
ncbi:MarR family winged helix-turn-helix transcriptional regulator [Conexibacter sp. DBS9H8]|uniref:MarR family winged helix-turn-helix transcriptional regulator n=1 Tax=Conexibacter sp. DBS9H8 TaxID=2937801 RepID=UPI00200DC6B2|nr:MarR family transcriptional regulator [Conexibacter sp. DBS9H8]